MNAQNSQHEKFAIRVTGGTPGMRSSWFESDHAHHGVQGSHVEHVIASHTLREFPLDYFI